MPVAFADLILLHGRIVTPPARAVALGPPPELTVWEDGAVAVADGRILAVGQTSEVLSRVSLTPTTRVIDAAGRAVLPGFVDPHTYLLRSQEGDAAGVATACADALRLLLQHGTTTAEVKVDVPSRLQLQSLRDLDLLARLRRRLGADLVPTLVVSDTDREGTGDVGAGTSPLIEAATRKEGVRFIEVPVRGDARSATETLLRAVDHAGLGAKVQVTADGVGAGELAARLGVLAATLLDWSDELGLRALAAAGVAAVLLPGMDFAAGRVPFPAGEARRLRLLAALGTGVEPGRRGTFNQAMGMALAVHKAGFTPAEALVSVTVNAARAVGQEEDTGSVTVGKRADLVVLAGWDWRDPVYHFGTNLVETVVAAGQVRVWHGRPLERGTPSDAAQDEGEGARGGGEDALR